MQMVPRHSRRKHGKRLHTTENLVSVETPFQWRSVRKDVRWPSRLIGCCQMAKLRRDRSIAVGIVSCFSADFHLHKALYMYRLDVGVSKVTLPAG
jgi:hypothetical protein